MALDIGVGDGTSPVPIRDEPMLSLEDDVLYTFLHPLFERLRTETGQSIDLYGDASFTGWRLESLRRMLVQARAKAESLPDSPRSADLLKRSAVLDRLADWERVIDRAQQRGKPVVCYGD